LRRTPLDELRAGTSSGNAGSWPSCFGDRGFFAAHAPLDFAGI
jgi:hypothetical protein